MSADEAEAGVREGDVLAGKYRVERVLGVGGMGVVVAAYHLALEERVALKFLLPGALSDPAIVARFDREARAAVKIKSEHVARTIDVGRLDSGAPYIVMEYLEGGDLARWLRDRGPLPVDQAIEFVLQACEALAEAHGMGIVHRDLKPANLFWVRRADGTLAIKVLDFGISKVVGGGGLGRDASLTRTNALMGSPLYMSPEQLQDPKTVDSRSDIWALGVVLFELVAGRGPFSAETLPELVHKIASVPAESLAALRPDMAQLDPLIARCLAKDRAARYANVGELAQALLPLGPARLRPSVERISRIVHGASVDASSTQIQPLSAASAEPAVSRTGEPAPGQASAALPALGRTTMGWARRRSARAAALLGVVAAACVAGSVGVFAWTARPQIVQHPDASPVLGSDPTTTIGPVDPPVRLVVDGGPQESSRDAAGQSPVETIALDAGWQTISPGAKDGGHVAASVHPPRPVASATPTCTVVQDYDDEGQPHFKKICK